MPQIYRILKTFFPSLGRFPWKTFAEDNSKLCGKTTHSPAKISSMMYATKPKAISYTRLFPTL